VLAVILQHQASSHAGDGQAGLAAAIGHTFWWAVGFTALALIPALLLPGTRPERPKEPAAAGAPARSAEATASTSA
jgi:predicted cobalt transporter CbtA